MLPNNNCKNSVDTVIFLLFRNCQLSTVTLSKQYDVNKYHHKSVIRMMAKKNSIAILPVSFCGLEIIYYFCRHN